MKNKFTPPSDLLVAIANTNIDLTKPSGLAKIQGYVSSQKASIHSLFAAFSIHPSASSNFKISNAVIKYSPDFIAVGDSAWNDITGYRYDDSVFESLGFYLGKGYDNYFAMEFGLTCKEAYYQIEFDYDMEGSPTVTGTVIPFIFMTGLNRYPDEIGNQYSLQYGRLPTLVGLTETDRLQ